MNIVLHFIFWSLLVMTSVSFIYSYFGRHCGCGDSMVGIGPLIGAVIVCIPFWILTLILMLFFVPVNVISTSIMLFLFACNNEYERYLFYKSEMLSKRFGGNGSWPAISNVSYDFRPIPYLNWRIARLMHGYLYLEETQKLCDNEITKRHRKMIKDLKFFKKIIIEDLCFYDKINIKIANLKTFNDITIAKLDFILDEIFNNHIVDIRETRTVEYGLVQKCILTYTLKSDKLIK